MLPEYCFDSGCATPRTNSCPRLYVLLFIMVVIPENDVPICKVADPPKISTLPSNALALPSNFKHSNPYLGDEFTVPSLLNPTFVLSCQYFRTPVV